MPQIELVPRSSLTQLKWWDKLSPSEQRTVLVETQGFVENRVRMGFSRLAMGKHLLAIREILEPKKVWYAFLKSQKNISRASAYRYIDAYQRTQQALPELVVRTALAKGYDYLSGEVIEKMPPPKTRDRQKIEKYLDRVVSKQRKLHLEAHSEDSEPDAMLRESVHYAVARFNRLPADSRLRMRWRERFVSFFLSETGVTEEKSFSPVSVPEGFRVIRGRPRENKEAA